MDLIRKALIILLMVLSGGSSCLVRAESTPAFRTEHHVQSLDFEPAFAEVLLMLTAMADQGYGFSSIEMEEEITAGGHVNAKKVSLLLPGAKACLLSNYDKSYVAWFGDFSSLASAKSKVSVLSKDVANALGSEYKAGDDYFDAKRGTFMRFFYRETDMIRSSTVVSIELAFFDEKYQIRLSVPDRAPENYLRSSYYDDDTTSESVSFNKGFQLILKGLKTNFEGLMGAVTETDLLSGKRRTLNVTLPGMTCTAVEKPTGLNPEYCTCISDASYPDWISAEMPYANIEIGLLSVYKPMDYVIVAGRNMPGDENTIYLAMFRPGGFFTEKVVCLYKKMIDGRYHIGVSIRDVEHN